MWKLLQTISKNLVMAIPAVMILGFVSGLMGDVAWLKGLIVPFTFLMVYPMMVTLKINQVFSGGDVKAQIVTQVVNFALVPFLAFGVAWFFFRDQPYMMLGIVLAGLVPTSGMTISWTGFAGGNVAAAVKMTVIGLTLGSLATPLYVRALLGASIEMNISAVFSQIVLIVFLPMALGYATQRHSGERSTARKPLPNAWGRASQPCPPSGCWASSSSPWPSRPRPSWAAPGTAAARSSSPWPSSTG